MTFVNKQRILERLCALGQTTDQVASNLEWLNIKGIPGSNWSCPIARFVGDQLPPKTSVRVMISADSAFSSILITRDGEYLPPYVINHSDCPVVFNFAIQFDNGAYPHLQGAPCTFING